MKFVEFERLALSLGLFDPAYYARQARMTFADTREAFTHFHEKGWREGLRPSRLFDTSLIVARNPGLAESGRNPLFHHLKAERPRGRRPRRMRGPIADWPGAPDPAVWTDLAERGARAGSASDDAGAVDVVVPVYGAYDQTLACLEAVLSSRNATPFRLVVIDDCGPDPALAVQLKALAGLGLIELLRNARNLGFVATANRGMKLSRRRDVVLLNSDTIVYGDWLDRLRAQARAGERVATVTPLSNNATILSYPYAGRNNYQELEIGFDRMDRLCASTLAGRWIEIPTGVGFCLYVTRGCIDENGVFNAEVFGRGYAEENDLCRRAAGAGWSNRVALDVFVRHAGEVSFASSSPEAKAAAREKMLALHPDYRDVVQAFVAADPLAPAREALDMARAAAISGGRGVLVIGDDPDAGAEGEDGPPVFRAGLDKDGKPRRIDILADIDLPNLPVPPFDDAEGLAAMLKALRLGEVRIGSLAGFPSEWRKSIETGVESAGLG